VLLNDTQIPRSVQAVAADLHTQLTPEWTTFLADCQLRGLPVLHAGTVYERLTGRVSLRYLRACALQGVHPSRAQMAAKRAGELLLIALLSPFLVLVMASTALAIRLESEGPVFFWQERIGLNNRPFWMVKFRSMRAGADGGGAAYAQRGDARITRVGAFIRRTRIDELPQLYNVLRGDMSLIGPRPEQVPFARHFADEIPFYSSRHHVRPGITGWAQVRSGYAADAEETAEKLAYDLFYVRHLSFWLDAVIAWNTIRTILTGAGAR
jgi:exopolysaccharide biosynthesis polyprenyl glycosylphosphotransferase